MFRLNFIDSEDTSAIGSIDYPTIPNVGNKFPLQGALWEVDDVCHTLKTEPIKPGDTKSIWIIEVLCDPY